MSASQQGGGQSPAALGRIGNPGGKISSPVPCPACQRAIRVQLTRPLARGGPIGARMPWQQASAPKLQRHSTSTCIVRVALEGGQQPSASTQHPRLSASLLSEGRSPHPWMPRDPAAVVNLGVLFGCQETQRRTLMLSSLATLHALVRSAPSSGLLCHATSSLCA